ncbi:uncharacterized protein LOC110250825 [Exaiptasia diaphana]|uniref:Uncharacterized protein n=1 Tax=Exaiptasia diaphana TaxID=2652724 RepID=A0A913Y0D1_EXADI|nr:uncharacterized protein LOC110250825 [Exaiptasia diaphana]XP_020913128.1 uncharacterized protein LOC110250825 [Exaiptasia diaphana]XP_020913129.1 uncharacterized protein LOC110250825 [Exaiptasia diaphana]XP_020913130.1 uncharacterized protein LOC110250825 [Exaiptasia diaphana]KXJ07345.1 hypothetical protein AC249_AIPGENE24607 [Exaiptasia diaphana]
MAHQMTKEEIIEAMDIAFLKSALINVKEDVFTELCKEYNKATDGKGQQGAPPNCSKLIDNGDHVSPGVDPGFREACTSTSEDRQAVQATENDDYSFANSHQSTIDFLKKKNKELSAANCRLEDKLQFVSQKLQELKCKLADFEKENLGLKQRDVGGVNLETFHVNQDKLISLKKTNNLLKHDLENKTSECENNTKIMWQLHGSLKKFKEDTKIILEVTKLYLEGHLAAKEQEILFLKEELKKKDS